MYDPWCTFYIDLPLACKRSVWLAGEVFFKQTNETNNKTKQNQVTSLHAVTIKGVCIKREWYNNNNYAALCIYKPYSGESESQGKISIH